jgi:hypothetical protein
MTILELLKDLHEGKFKECEALELMKEALPILLAVVRAAEAVGHEWLASSAKPCKISDLADALAELKKEAV